jgi:hypothetical protein
MSADTFETPILLVVFNRPETTQVVFDSIRSVQPAELFVAGDGPRPRAEGEREQCLAARRIATAVDWTCSVRTRFREENSGLAANMTGAITWFFQHVESGIILEDDCVPAYTFYRFCQELLRHYRNVGTVMHISGDNFQYGRRRGMGSYYFSRYAHCWGWATWRRAWEHFSLDTSDKDRAQGVWSRQWQAALERAGGVSILPNANLVTNIGFGPSATHTKMSQRYARLKTQPLGFPLVHPSSLAVDTQADRFTYYVHFRNVRYPRCIWAYQLSDKLVSGMKGAKRALGWKGGAGRLDRRPERRSRNG